MKMLDTNICIYTIKQKPVEVLNRFREEIPKGLCISAITLAELKHGVEKSAKPKQNEMALAQLLVALTVIPFDDLAAVEYGKICADLERKGRKIGTMDMLIAASALSEGMTLVTNNTREFERVSGLSLENWVQDN
jgi:tRNA(fMet)-specific endonuclease VapC